jgi:hypothetical protein
VARWLQRHLGSRDVSRVIDGAIVGLALILALQSHPPPPGRVAGVLLGTAGTFGLAEVYSETIALEARTRRAVGAAELRRLAGGSLAIVFGVGFPAVFFVLAAAHVIDTPLAFTLSKWSGLGLISGYGFLAARLAGASVRRALVRAAAAGFIAGLLIALKAVLH